MGDEAVNRSEPVSPDRSTATDLAARKRRIVRWLLAYSAALGVLIIFLPEEGGPMEMLAGLPLLILAVAWCFADAEERELRISGILRVLLVLLFLLGFPIYVFRSRGLGGFKTLGLVVLLVAGMAICYLVAAAATYFLAEAFGFLPPVG